MKTTMRISLPALALAAALATNADAAKTSAKPAAAVPDSALGFAKASVFSIPVPASFRFNALVPGKTKPLPRAFPGMPPRVPHTVSEYLPITRAENQCLECHDAAGAVESGAVPIPASHYRDLRRAPDAARQQVAGARYVCLGCHVPTTDATPLVGSRFGVAAKRR